VKVWIETRYAVDLRDGNVDFRGKLLQTDQLANNQTAAGSP